LADHALVDILVLDPLVLAWRHGGHDEMVNWFVAVVVVVGPDLTAWWGVVAE